MDKKEVTIYTLAKELNVSVASISRAFKPDSVLSEEKRKLILKTADKYGYSPNAGASRLSQKVLQIGVLIYSHMKIYDEDIAAGIEKAYSELKGLKVRCDVRWMIDGDQPLEQAVSVLDEFRQNHYDGVIISKLPKSVAREKIDELDQAGIRTVIFDSDIPDSRRYFVSMSDVKARGEIVAELFGMGLSKYGRKIAVVCGKEQDELLQSFFEGAADEGFSASDIITIYVSPRDTEEADADYLQKLEALFNEHPDVSGIYVSMANCIPVCKFLNARSLQNSVMLITSDIFDEMQPYFENRTIDASIYQDPFSQGYEAMKNLYYGITEHREIPEKLLTRPQVIFRGNARLYQKDRV